MEAIFDEIAQALRHLTQTCGAPSEPSPNPDRTEQLAERGCRSSRRWCMWNCLTAGWKAETSPPHSRSGEAPLRPKCRSQHPALLTVQLWCQRQMTHCETPACVGSGGKSCAGQAWHGPCVHCFRHAGTNTLFHIGTGIW